VVHELPIVTHLLASVEVEASAAGATRVVAVNLVVGERAGVVYDSLRFYFDILTPGTVADGARLNVRRLPMRFRCARCADDYSPGPADFDCPRCGEVGGLTDGATDLLIESLEVES
jgi:hydrogenase nickel incorporation protein HypA/HybF